jgi:N-acylneuraminate cytidylyltransferase
VSTCAFIFARGGSKGLPGKNIKPLGGIPLIGHSINTALQVQAVDRVFVSTDSDEIASIASSFSVEVIKRPAELASDTASEWLAWRHAIEHVQAQHPFDVFLSLPATSPLRSIGDVEQCLDALDEHTDVVVTVTPAARSPYFNMVTRSEEGLTAVVLSSSDIIRRQDAPVVFDMTTVAYVARPNFILKNSGIFTGRVRSVVIPKERAVDIDDEFDFLIAEVFYKNDHD